MSAQQIQGRLQAHHDHGWLVIESDCGGLYIKVEKGSAASKSMPAARRLVACWNACEGISTESLERGPLSKAFELEQDRADSAGRQRDELLAALNQVRGEVQYMASGMTHSTWRTKQAQDAMANIDAAIAKVKGGTA